MSDEKFIAVLMGGISPEREISLQSGNAVADALEKTNNVVRITVNDDIVKELDNYKIDIAFIALHGYFGEDGRIQEILESKGIAYTGSGISASRLAMNKVEAKGIFKRNNIPTPEYFKACTAQSMSEITTGIKNLKLPVIIKPVNNGSSIGISIIKDYTGIIDAFEHAGRYCRELLVEECIEGRELAVSILENKALPVIEIKTPTAFYDYDSKYKNNNTQYIILEPSEETSEYTLSHTVYDKVQELAVRAHDSLGCSNFSRVDMILDKDDKIYVLEVNTIPGFTERSLLPKAAAAANISFVELCNTIIETSHTSERIVRTCS